ncbi:MAG TPA: GNAT family N-acetyltransferase [Myxococcaceae bacterium]|nr:GNAT family N-acetyltransferase [Myxococcaceae bacterium]
MTDAELTARLYANIRAFKLVQAEHGPLRTLALPGVHAFALPSRLHNLFQQQVLYETPEALGEALATLEAWYRSLRVHAWRVPVLPGDLASEWLLARSGYRPEDTIPAMGLLLAHAPALPPGLALVRPDDLDEVLALNALAYGEEDVAFFQAWRTAPLPSPATPAVVLREGGRAVAGGVSFEQEGVAGIYLVATHPEARRRGLGAAVMHGLHADARARGCTAAVLQASLLGHGLYRHLGSRELGAWTNWVRRTD